MGSYYQLCNLVSLRRRQQRMRWSQDFKRRFWRGGRCSALERVMVDANAVVYDACVAVLLYCCKV